MANNRIVHFEIPANHRRRSPSSTAASSVGNSKRLLFRALSTGSATRVRRRRALMEPSRRGTTPSSLG